MAAWSKNKHGLSKMIIILLLGFIALVIVGVVFIVIGSKNSPAPANVKLTIWGAWDNSSDWNSIISAYRRTHPYIQITYVKKRFEEYQDQLLKAWATNTGPDAYALPNTWVNEYRKDFIRQMPASTKIAFYTTKKVLFKTDTKISFVTEKTLTPKDIKRDYIDVVYNDVVFDNGLYALPLGVNTLVLYYNKDLLNLAHLVEPPQTWTDFSSTVGGISIVDEQNNIARAGTALGTYDNIPRASDIVTLLMLQNGARMVTDNKITFNNSLPNEQGYVPAAEALRFYTDFATPEKEVYTWNDQMPNALDFFAQGKLAFFFGYRYQEPSITAQAQGLNYGIAPVPQIDQNNEVNFANYWVYTVAKQSKRSNEAWDFLEYAAEAAHVKSYLKTTKQTSALRSVLNEQLKDPDQALFAKEALTAQSWYHGLAPQKADGYFADMIKQVVTKQTDIDQAIKEAAKAIQSEY